MKWHRPVLHGIVQWGNEWQGLREPGTRLTYDISSSEDTMRVVFNLEVRAEIDSFDHKQRDIFIKLMTDAAKRLHTQAVLLSHQVSPDMVVTVQDHGGRETIRVFNGEKK
jgi:hypothetical protein